MSNTKRIETLARECIALMRVERSAILSADFDALPKLAQQKDDLANEIERRMDAAHKQRETPESLAQREKLRSLASILTRRATENLKLLKIASESVQSVQQLLQTSETEKGNVGLYAADGTRIPDRGNFAQNSTKI